MRLRGCPCHLPPPGGEVGGGRGLTLWPRHSSIPAAFTEFQKWEEQPETCFKALGTSRCYILAFPGFPQTQPLSCPPDSTPIRPHAHSTASLWPPHPRVPTLGICTTYTLMFQKSCPWSPISGIIPLFPLSWKLAGHSHVRPLHLPQSDSAFSLSAPLMPLGSTHVRPSVLTLHGWIVIPSHLVCGQQQFFCFHFYPHVCLNLSVHPHHLLLEASCKFCSSKYKLQSLQSGPLSLSSSSTRMHASTPRKQITVLW